MDFSTDLIAELTDLGAGEVRTDLAARILYSTDASIYQMLPLGVLLPRHQEGLHAAVEFSSRHKVPILPRGSGTSLAGQAIGEAMILDCSRWLDRIVEIDPENQTATVEPGVLLSTLNRAASRHGLQFGPDPASADRATLGGVIANNATGAHSIMYGMAADHLLQADVIFADGSLATLGEISASAIEQAAPVGASRAARFLAAAGRVRRENAQVIKRRFPQTWRNSAGYRLNYLLPWSASAPPEWFEGAYPPSSDGMINSAALLAGSEGTLAVIRRATVRLVPRPRHTLLGVLAYQSISDACDAVPQLLTHHPSAIELIPQLLLRLARAVAGSISQTAWVPGDPAALLVVEFSGDDPAELKQRVQRLRVDVLVAESAEHQSEIWKIRKLGLGILDSRPQSSRPVAFIEDCAIPVERLGEFVREMERILTAHHTSAGMYAHASGGCLHVRPLLDLKSPPGIRALRSIAEQTLALSLRLGGSMSSEHGDGLARGEWLEAIYGPELVEAMRRLKEAADPDGLLNPYKLFDAPPLDANLRFRPHSSEQPWTSALDFSRQGSLVAAIEQCNGQGLCRKQTGLMCPSFQATRDEMHSTRGRANLLRALISGRPVSKTLVAELEAPDASRSASIAESVKSALDLCLACKGCKAECPSGVDMAKLKFAFEAEYYRTHPRRPRAYIFGYFHVVAGLLSPLAPLANLVLQNLVLKAGVARALQITPHRPFPKFSQPATRRDGAPRKNRAHPADAVYGQLVFLTDAYGHYVDSHVELAALELLTALGFKPRLLPITVAVAALMSKGFVDGARMHARRIVRALTRMDPAASLPIVGLEPPEVYALRHDYADILPEASAQISAWAPNVWLLEEFLVRRAKFPELRIANAEPQIFTQGYTKVLFHPHCHQRAQSTASEGDPSGADATVALLRMCGYEVQLTEAACCGMAGTFGYESEHYALSMRVGELSLLPRIRNLALRNAGAPSAEAQTSRTVVASTGAACRMQILHGTGVAAVHPVELIRDALCHGNLASLQWV